jgi:hypothetical protein
MIHSAARATRRGYTLTVVLITLMMLFLLWSYAASTTSSLLRVETARVVQQTRDQGAMNALAQAIQLLEYSTPYDSNDPTRTEFVYAVSVSVPPTGEGDGCTSSSFTVVYTARPDQGPLRWEVQVYPGSSTTPLPAIGASPQWP